jgi:predicted GIY-YIG superfamily endonuclease
MPSAERCSTSLFKFLDTAYVLPFPQYEFSLPQDIPPGSKVYLIHFDKPLKHARHYLGYTENLPGRVQKHRNGQGAAFMKAIAQKGISWHVSRIWDGDRALERMLKDQHNASHLCPTCIQERIFEQTLSIVVNPVTKEKRPLRRKTRIQPTLWDE